MNDKHIAAAALTASAVALGIFISNFKIVRAVGPSMAPSIPADGALLLIDKLRFATNGAKPGDVVVFTQRRLDAIISACKRLIAVEGQTVKGLMVPSKHVWVEGDCLKDSRDSRYYGAVASNLVWGRALAVLWPKPMWLRRTQPKY